MNLEQDINTLKSLPDQALMRELAQPSGAVPSYLVLAEAQRRQVLRQAAQSQQNKPSGTVYDDVIRSMMARQPPSGPPPPAGMTPTPGGPPNSQMGGSPQMGTPPQNFKMPGMARGGAVRYDEGGEVDNGDDWSSSAARPNPQPPPVPKYDFPAMAQQVGAQVGLDPKWILAMMKAESANKPDAVSNKGAIGLMQLMPDTAQEMGVNPNDPLDNIKGGALYFQKLLKLYGGDYKQALAAYVAGPGAVAKGAQRWPSVQDYVSKVTKNHDDLADLEQKVNAPQQTLAAANDAAANNPGWNTAAAPTDQALYDLPLRGNDAMRQASLNALMGTRFDTPPPDMVAPSRPAAPALTPEQQDARDIQRAKAIRDAFMGSGNVDASFARDRQLIQQMQQQRAQQAKPNFWQSLANFGWGMANSPSHTILGQVAAGGAAMNKSWLQQQEEAKKAQEEILNLNLDLNQRQRAYQEKLADAGMRAWEAENRTAEAAQLRNQTMAQTNAHQTMVEQLQGRDKRGYQDATALVPGDSEAVPDLENPGKVYLVAPAFKTVTPEMAKFAQTLKAGQQIPYKEYQALDQKINTVRQGGMNAYAVAAGALGIDFSHPQNVSPEDYQKIEDRIASITHPQMKFDDQTLQKLAESYVLGGQAPSFGMGTSGLKARQDFYTRVADIAAKQGTTINELRARGLSDTDAIKKLTGTLAAVSAFEDTADRNLAMMMDTAKPIIDMGSPWINKPLRAVDMSGFGSTEVAAYNAARNVALSEISRVVSNPNLSGVLHANVRAEVLSLIPEDATLAQIYHVADILRKDMANRREGLANELSTLHQHLGTPLGGGANAPAATGNAPAPEPGGALGLDKVPAGAYKAIMNGHWIYVSGKQWIDAVTGKPVQ